MSSNSMCHYKRNSNPKPILAPCQKGDHHCIDYTLEHRMKSYHSAFGTNHEARLKFLMNSMKYVNTIRTNPKERTSFRSVMYDPNYDSQYLWEQFSCDFLTSDIYLELHREFLKVVYEKKIFHIHSLDDLEKEILYRTFMRLEEDSITGIHILNQSFLLWLFNKDSIYDLNKDVLKQPFNFHNERLFTFLKYYPILNKPKSLMEVKKLYSDFMKGSCDMGITVKQRYLRDLENKIIDFQDKFSDKNMVPLDEFSISNSAIVAITNPKELKYSI